MAIASLGLGLTIVIEDLSVSGMLANPKLAKSIADLGLYEFRRQLTYKCELYGSEIIILDRFFPSSNGIPCVSTQAEVNCH